jgi:ankyrin repeat protein
VYSLRHPHLARGSIHAAAVSGDLAEVERILAERPAAAREKGGPQSWEPLLYVCYGRLTSPKAAENAVEIARRLLDAGASQQVRLGDEQYLFWPLTGAIGEGEFSQPRHPRGGELAELLIERGADPYDAQALYNTSLEGDDLFWLDFLYERSARANEAHKWTAVSEQWPHSGMLNYLLGNAVTRGAIERAKWLLARGASADATHFYTKRKVHTEAVLLGFTAMADLLRDAGAVPEALHGRDELRAACMRAKLDAVAALARRHPEYLNDADTLIQVAERDLVDVATLLLDLGMSPDVRNHTNYRPLHAAALTDSVRVAALLVDRGAEIDPQEIRFNGTPLGWALFGKRERMIEFLGGLSRSPKSLVRMGHLERLRELFAAEPSLAKTIDANGSLYFYLPEDEERALEIAELLHAHGADPRARNSNGANAIEQLEKRALSAVADWLRSAAGQA